ncbi:MAG TPA: TIGR03960 family B12-binding radical SAM protein [Anaerolineales bacterium]|nr:TIGR03960 family B12-binding radical SAM protein [Anaerolineales bacterium]
MTSSKFLAARRADPAAIQEALPEILYSVEKPGRYTGGELNQVVKDWGAASVRVALAFPDVYDLGMSNLGLAVLYDILNRRPDTLAERVYAPWPDMEAALRRAGLPLYSLESKHALADFDLIGISLPYETLYTNTLTVLELGGVPLRTADRVPEHPVVIAGGHATYNPEPMAEFFDAFALGEGEDLILDVVEAIRRWKSARGSRADLHRSLAKIWGVYVPSLYRPAYFDDGSLSHVDRLDEEAPARVIKRIVPRLPPPPTRLLVPYIDVTHNRVPVEIMRGCTRGCRFCQAGMITRPVRERPVEEIVRAIEDSLAATGFEEVALLSLSSSDYDDILPLVRAVTERFAGRNLNLSLPSLRIESFSVELMDLLQGEAHRGGFTLAPEAGSERMRSIINKPVSTEQILETARAIYGRGWHTIKLYFMIGHPSETLDEVQAIADLCQSVLAEGRKLIGGRAKVTAGVSTFVPKPHTPFQWVPCDTLEQIRLKQSLLKRQLRGPGLKLNWNAPEETLLEAWLSRGDRRMSQVILAAWRRGARFDAWQEHFRYDIWLEAFAEAGLDPSFYTHRERPIDETLPWDHIDAAVRKEFLTEDYLWSLQGRTRVDCRERCFACGILPRFSDLRRDHPGETWECPEVKSPRRSIPVELRLPTNV